MKKSLLLLIVALLTFSLGYSQQLTRKTAQEFSAKVQAPHEVSIMPTEKGAIYTNPDKALGIWVLPGLGATSTNTRIPGNTHKYQRTVYLITPAEMAASGFPASSTVDAMGYIVHTAGLTSQSGNLKVYLMNTNDIYYTLGTSWNITGFTLAADISNWTVPINVGEYVIPFSGGSPFTYTGGGVYVAWEFSNPGTVGTTALVANCNTTISGALYGNRSTTSLPTTLAASDWRPGTMFVNNSIVDVVNLTTIYTLEKTVPYYTTPTPISVRAVNVSSTPATFDVIVTVKDSTNTNIYYTDTLTVSSLAADSAIVVNFTGWNPLNFEKVNITASTSVIPGETWIANNTISKVAIVNPNIAGFSIDHSNPGGFGFQVAGGVFLTKFFVSGTAKVKAANIVIANNAASVGNSVYAILMNSSAIVVAQSANHTILSSDLGLIKSFTFTTPPTLNNETYYIGLVQSAAATQYFPMGTFPESPNRDSTFFTADINLSNINPLSKSFNLKFGVEAVYEHAFNCIMPSQLMVDYTTPFAANLTWTENGNATQWQFAYDVYPFPTPTTSGINTTSNTLNLISGLNASTVYQFYVRALCDTIGFSSWAGPYNFTTDDDCQAYNLPFDEGFEGTTFPPLCWKNIDADGDNHKWQVGVAPSIAPKSGNQSATSASWIPNGPLTPDNYLVTPKLAIPATGPVVLKFWVAAQDPGYPAEKYSVLVSNTGNNPSDFTSIYSQVLADSAYQEIIIPLDNYFGQEIYLAFRHHDCTNNYFMKIDDVKVISTANIDLTAVASMKLYPNPTTDIVYISEKANVQVFNLHGQLVGSYNEVSQIDVTHLNAGMYFFRINTENKVHTTTINVIR